MDDDQIFLRGKEMAVRTKEELLGALKAKFGDDTADDTIAIIEDISDTYDTMANAVSESGNWKSKYEENDKEWREKYRDRFYSDEPPEPSVPITNTEEKKPKTFEELFKIGE